MVTIVLNWNNLPDTLECVASVLRSDYPNVAVWVVDNGSQDDPTGDLRAMHPEVRIIRNPKNMGYGGGNNSGLRLAMAEGAAYVLLLNNDAVIAEDTLRHLVLATERDSRIAMATPTVFYYDRPKEIYWDGGSVDWKSGWASHNSHGLPVEGKWRKSEWLDGCALFVRVSAIADVGLLDERYFLYFEDTEWSVRAARCGWINAVVLEAHAWHKLSRSTGGRAVPAVQFYYARNRYLFMRSHNPSRNCLKWRVSYAWSMLQEYWCVRRKREARQAIVVASLSALGGRWGSYDSVGTVERQLALLLDTVVLPLLKCVRVAKRCVLRVGRACSRPRGTKAGSAQS